MPRKLSMAEVSALGLDEEQAAPPRLAGSVDYLAEVTGGKAPKQPFGPSAPPAGRKGPRKGPRKLTPGEVSDLGLEPAPSPVAAPPPSLPPPAAAPPSEPETTSAEASLRGGAAGFFPFIDEAAGIIKSLAETRDIRKLPEAYRRTRDEERARTKLTEREHPAAFTGSKVGGAVASAFVPGLGLAKTAGLGVKLAKAAATGAGYALGESEADLTKGEVGEAAKDVGLGAGTALATAGLLHGGGKLAEKAAKRVFERPATDLLQGVAAKTQDKALAKLGGRGGFAQEVRSDKELLRAAAQGPGALAATAETKLDDVGNQIGQIYAQVDKAKPDGIALGDVTNALFKLQQKHKAAGNAAEVAQLDREIATLGKLWGDQNVVKQMPHVTAEQVHNVVKRYGRAGFEGGGFANPSDAKKLGREMNATVRDVLQEHIDKGTGQRKALEQLNSKYSRLAAVLDVAEEQAKRVERNAPTLGQHIATATKATGLAVGGWQGAKDIEAGRAPSLSTVVPLAIAGARPLGRGADVVLAGLYRFLQTGGSKTEVLRRAAEAGIPRATAETMVRTFGGGNPK